MTVSVRVYVPLAVADAAHKDVKATLADQYGGYSALEVEGGWVADDGTLVEETTFVYESVADADAADAADVARDAAECVADASDEDAVMWEIRPVETRGFA